MSTLRINIDSLSNPTWSEQEQANVRLISTFVQQLMNDHDFDQVLSTHGSDNYVQHNRNIPDGIPALVAFVRDFAKRFPDYTYDVKRILADGETVTFHSHATVNSKHRGDDGKGLNIIDIWQVQNGQITRHWDAIQPLDAFMRSYVLLTGGRIRNANGVF